MEQYNSEASNLAFKVRWLYHHFVEDPGAIDASLFADDFTWIPAESSPASKFGNVIGLTDFLAKAYWSQPEWGQFGFRIDEILANEKIVMQGYYTGVYKPTGTVLCAQMLHVWSFENSKLTRLDELTDTQHFFEVKSDS